MVTGRSRPVGALGRVGCCGPPMILDGLPQVVDAEVGEGGSVFLAEAVHRDDSVLGLQVRVRAAPCCGGLTAA